MFDMKRPCKTCPFRKGQGENFRLDAKRLKEITQSVAFQCHNTVDYEHFDDPYLKQGQKPQQCAGLMTLLAREGIPNQIMRVAQLTQHLEMEKLDPHGEVYATLEDAYRAHGNEYSSKGAKGRLRYPRVKGS